MKSYGGFERTVAKVLEAFPGIRNVAKTAYHRLNYAYFGERNFTLALHPQVELFTPEQWLGREQGVNDEELFFGYYDKSPWSPDMLRLLLHRPTSDGHVDIIVVDQAERKIETVAISSAWNYQQGSMLQWLADGRKIIFNDCVDGCLAARIISIKDREEQILFWPIQVVHPNGREGLSLNYTRLDRLRPDYGYNMSVKNFRPDQALDEDGIWWLSLESGQADLRLSLADLMLRQPRPEMAGAAHKVNHLYYSPQGARFVFMHRWLGPRGKFSRLYVIDSDGGDLRLLLDDRMVSHYSWRDEDHVLAWARTEEQGDHYYLINVITGQWEVIGKGVLDVHGDGHPTFSPDRRWIITDSYPDRARQRHLLLFNVEKQKVVKLGRFFAPWRFDGIQRCDLHPRWSPNGQYISFDSAHEGIRKSYIVDPASLL